jgi:hypothetical protein
MSTHPDGARSRRAAAGSATTRKVLAGVAIAGLAAAAAAAMVAYRQGHRPGPDEQAHFDELDARLMAQESTGATTPNRVGRMLDGLHRKQDISIGRLRRWITGARQGTLNSEQVTLAESDFDTLEREADQGGL